MNIQRLITQVEEKETVWDYTANRTVDKNIITKTVWKTSTRATVEEMTMTLAKAEPHNESWPNTKVELKVCGVRYNFEQNGFPRIDVGEEIVLHHGGSGTVYAIQVVKNGAVVFRLKTHHAREHRPQRDKCVSVWFEDELTPTPEAA